MNTEAILLKMSPELRTLITKEANSKGLSLNAYIRMILIENTKKDEPIVGYSKERQIKGNKTK